MVQCVDEKSSGNQRIVYVSELTSDDEDFFTSTSGDSGERNTFPDNQDFSTLICCMYGNCSCNSFHHALAYLDNNVLINITTDVMLSSFIKVSHLTNVSITGHNDPTIHCNNIGAVKLIFCHNCVIQGITWDRCGYEKKPALKLSNSFNIKIKNCSFQHSKGQAIVLSNMLGDVIIDHCHFKYIDHQRYHGAAIHYLLKNITTGEPLFKINNCNFTYNNCKGSVVYLENRIFGHKHNIFFHNSTFHNNQGVSIYAINQNIYLNGKILFQNNVGTGIHIIDHSYAIFGNDSEAEFIQNFANHRGGAVFLSNNSGILFDQNSIVTFSGNNADSGGAVYTEASSNITFTATCHVIFTSNIASTYGAAIYSSANDLVHTIRYHEGISPHKQNFISFEGNSFAIFINNTSNYNGGAIYSYGQSYISFEGNSSAIFSNNTSIYGGAIYCSYISFKENSSVIFNYNAAEVGGGAIQNDIISFEGNSSTIFKNNNVVWVSGGAIKGGDIISFDGNSTSTFSNNSAWGGGAISCWNCDSVTFKGNSTTKFSNNIATWKGGAIYCKSTHVVSFKDKSSTVFTDNSALYGGAIHGTKDVTISFKGFSVSVFKNNVASLGGAIYIDENISLILSHNSTVRFANNKATVGATVYSVYDSIKILQHSIIVINGQLAKWCKDACLQIIDLTDVTIAIDSSGIVWCKNPKAFICLSKNCYCNSLEDFVFHARGGSLVNITDTVVSSSSSPVYIHSSNIAIIGHNDLTVICMNGSFPRLILDGNNITIKDITWIGCGYGYYGSNGKLILFRGYGDLLIQNCTFQYSGVQDIHIDNSFGTITISHCNFMYHSQYGGHGAAIEYNSNNGISRPTFDLVLINCNFSYNRDAKSLVYIFYTYDYVPDLPDQPHYINIDSSNFYNNQGTSIYLSSSQSTLYIQGEVLFEKNVAENAAAIYINHDSVVIFDKSCKVKFIGNTAEQNGATIFLNENSSIKFEQSSLVSFNHNKATNGIIYSNNSNITFQATSEVIFSSNSVTQYGAAIYSSKTSHVKFTGNATVTFINNIVSSNIMNLRFGGTIFSESYSHLSFEGHSTTLFINNTARFGAAILSLDHSIVIYKDRAEVIFNNNTAYYCGVMSSAMFSSIIFTNNTKVTYDTNVVLSYILTINDKSSAGAICVFQTVTIIFSRYSLIKFINNTGLGSGAIVISESTAIMKDHSVITFSYNIALFSSGGAFACYNSTVAIKGHSNVTFISNRVSQGGGAIYSYATCKLTFEENSTASFINNKALRGGAILVNSNVTIPVAGHSVLLFVGNEATERGGAAYFEYLCTFTIKEYAKVTFDTNKALDGGAICINSETGLIFQDNSDASFHNNLAIVGGGAVSVLHNSTITLQDHFILKFANNHALYGAAIYVDRTAKIENISDHDAVMNFTNNLGKISGNSVYQDVAEVCNSSCLSKGIVGIDTKHITTQPNKLKFYNPAICIDEENDSQCNSYYIRNVMLGSEIVVPACVLDYYDRPITDSTQFLIESEIHPNYFVSGPKQVLISCTTFQGISMLGNQIMSKPTNFSLTINSNVDQEFDWKQISVTLTVGLSPCHAGFWQYSTSQKCECYNDNNDIIFCSGSGSTIKRGYWFGSVTGKPAVTFCPINFCNFTCCETSNGYYQLSPGRDDQCRSHRAGAACGICKDGYTLSFDSTECVDVESCTAGQTIMVALLTVIYWIVMITLVFAMMYFKIDIGYLYSITYYYSVVDILLSQNLLASRGLYLTVNIISSFSKLTPQFLGEFCLTTGMSGIDQQFIHYLHPSAVLIILIMITLLARISIRISTFISRGIIRVICLLLLLSYTSLASTSLLLIRPLTFYEINKVYTYSSPDIEYFYGRHLAYGIVALLCIICIVIGLPLLLILEPHINHKINFTRIKPLLDQFQGCYKDKYRCLAAYYMICRVLIITIVIINSFNDFITNYVLIIVSGVIGLMHLLIKPYNSKILNKVDGIVLQLISFITVLPLFDDSNSPLVITITFILVILPLFNFIVMMIVLHKDDLKKVAAYFSSKDELPHVSSDETPMREFNLVIDNNMRQNATVCDM